MKPLERYRWLQIKLLIARMHGTEADEDPILDEMDRVWWYDLSDEDRKILDTDPS
jgi:hypothetical protein